MLFHTDILSEVPVQFDQDFSIQVLGDGRGSSVLSSAIKVVGNRLIARIGDHLPEGTAVSIPCRDGQVLAEVIGCWRERQFSFGAFEIRHSIRKVELVSGGEAENYTSSGSLPARNAA
jgi:hypothetical protein